MNQADRELVDYILKYRCHWAGVGARNAPLPFLSLATAIAYKMAMWGYLLFSGGAKGMDSAFEEGVDKARKKGAFGRLKRIYYAREATQEAMDIAGRFHPYWANIKQDYVKQLHGRNAFQILGPSLSVPVMGVLCWTPDGCNNHADRGVRTGGTGTAISIANAWSVPISNLHDPAEFHKWQAWANAI